MSGIVHTNFSLLKSVRCRLFLDFFFADFSCLSRTCVFNRTALQFYHIPRMLEEASSIRSFVELRTQRGVVPAIHPFTVANRTEQRNQVEPHCSRLFWFCFCAASFFLFLVSLQKCITTDPYGYVEAVSRNKSMHSLFGNVSCFSSSDVQLFSNGSLSCNRLFKYSM